jgi:tetrahydromethanopterin S-methyltransferase subunit G
MAEESTNGHGESRLDRMEKLMELLIQDHLAFRDDHRQFRDDFRQLLTAQVVLTDRVDKLTQRMDKLAERMDRLAETSQRADERMDALIAVVDGVVRRPPPQTP